MKTIEITWRGAVHAVEVDTLDGSIRIFNLHEVQRSGYLEDPKRKRDCDRARSGQAYIDTDPASEAASVAALSGLTREERAEVFALVRGAMP